MFQAVSAFFQAFFVIFTAIGRGARAVDHIASLAEMEAEALRLQREIELKANLEQLRRTLPAAPQQ